MNVRTILTKITYRPGWAFSVDDSGDVVVTARVLDNRNPGHRTRIRGYVTDPWRFKTEWALLEQIMGVIDGLNEHEAREQFKYRGRRYFDPHK